MPSTKPDDDTTNNLPARRQHSSVKRRNMIASIITVTAIVATSAHVIWPHLKIDNITVILLVAAIAPWLGDLFSKIELPGGARLEYKQLEQRIEATEEHATRLDYELDDTAATARVALAAAGNIDLAEPDDAKASDEVRRLAKRYERIRASMPSSSARTAEQERVFAALIKATSACSDLDVTKMLFSERPGERLAAYARLYTIPDPAQLDPLVNAVLQEKLPFLKYWGLNVLGQTVDYIGADKVPLGIVQRLRTHLLELPSGTNRAASIQRILSKMEVN